MSDTPDISKCPKCGGGRTHAEGGVSYGHCSSSWGPAWDRGELTVYNQGSGCRIRQLERELAEARIEIGKANVHTAHWQACCSEDTIAQLHAIKEELNEVKEDFFQAREQLTAHKAALEKCEKALGDHGTLCSTELRYGDLCDCGLVVAKTEALFEIAKLTSSTSVNPNQPSQ